MELSPRRLDRVRGLAGLETYQSPPETIDIRCECIGACCPGSCPATNLAAGVLRSNNNWDVFQDRMRECRSTYNRQSPTSDKRSQLRKAHDRTNTVPSDS